MAALRLDRFFIRVSGPEARDFLHNLLTQNVLELQGAGYGALLNPQGKLICDMLLWARGQDVLIEADPARGPDLLRRLMMYRLRRPVGIERAALSALFSPEAFAGGVPDPRLPNGALGWRGVAETPEGEDGAAAYEALRLAAGVPDLARDAGPEEAFGLEALLDELNGVDFQKGCFVGQENVSRMKRRATTRKKLSPIAFAGPAPAFGTPILAGDAEIGSVRTGEAGRAIAFLRLDRALESAAKGVELRADGRLVRLDLPNWLTPPEA